MVENIFLTIWSQRTEKLIQRRILRMLDLRMSKASFDFTFLKEGRAYRTIQAASTVHHVSRNLKLEAAMKVARQLQIYLLQINLEIT